MTEAPTFSSNHLRWPIERTRRRFRVHVVEPEFYDPPSHAAIFYAAVNSLIQPNFKLADQLAPLNSVAEPEDFDLLTFPEAFLPATVLVETLNSVCSWPTFGCVHVGLRPDEGDNHLFVVSQIEALIESIAKVAGLEIKDLSPFSSWLAKQKSGHRFNLGCVFTVDAGKKVRVCLHPKVVRSKFEFSPLPEHNMEEADLLTLVTLMPTGRTFFSVTLQPLICSDALNLPTDRKLGPPMPAVDRFAGIFGEHAPDHIDVVSVSTCTPQVETVSKGGSYRSWHQEFQNTFVSAARDDNLARHHFAAIVLANFRTLPKETPGGLSGIFLPVAPPESFPRSITTSAWGRPKSQKVSNRWSTPDDGALSEWSGLGYLAALEPSARHRDTPARILDATIEKLPRDASPWKQSEGLTSCSIRLGAIDEDGKLQFSTWEPSDV